MPRVIRNSVERKIYFYRANAGTDESGSPSPFDITPALKHIRTLPYTYEGNYWEIGDGDHIVCLVDRTDLPQRIRLGTSRRSSLPQIERSGRTTPLELEADSGLLEQTHIVVFPGNIVGVEFNFYGPRLGRLRGYFRAKSAGLAPDVDFEQLLRQDVSEKLERMREMRLFHFGIRRPFLEALRTADEELGAAFDTPFAATDADIAEIIVRVRPNDRRASLSDDLFRWAQRVLRIPGLREEATKLQVRARNPDSGRIEMLDLLKDQLIAVRGVVKQSERSRAIDPQSAYSAIELAYSELSGEIEKAASIIL